MSIYCDAQLLARAEQRKVTLPIRSEVLRVNAYLTLSRSWL